MELKVTYIGLIFSIVLVQSINSQQALYSQCDGFLFTGVKRCVSGASCFRKDMWYSQCLLQCPNDPSWDCSTMSTTTITSTTTTTKTTIRTRPTTTTTKTTTRTRPTTTTTKTTTRTRPTTTTTKTSTRTRPTTTTTKTTTITRPTTTTTKTTTTTRPTATTTKTTTTTRPTTTTTKTTTITRPTTYTTIQTTTTNNLSVQRQYEQCGGNLWTGPTVCDVGLICFKKDDWYSQCLSSCPQDLSWVCYSSQNTLTQQTSSTTTSSPKPTTNTLRTTKPTIIPSITTKTTTTKTATGSTIQTSATTNMNQILYNVLATRHGAYEIGACELPKASYSVNNPVALGDINALGYLKFRPDLCGHILTIDCGYGSMDIIITNSNLGGGLDLYASTWDIATNKQPPGQSKCSVQLTNKNIFTTSGYYCYYATGETNNDYYHNVGLLNIGARIVKAATLNGVSGSHRGSNPYYAFDGKASSSDIVTFYFEDGGSYNVSLSNCASGADKQYWS